MKLNSTGILALLFLFLTSCHSLKNTLTIAPSLDASEPEKGNFIRLKTGKIVKLPEELEQDLLPDLALGETRILKIGGDKFKAKEVDNIQISNNFYQTLENNKKAFARRIYRGPLNIYSFTSIHTRTDSKGLNPQTYYIEHFLVQKPSVLKNQLTLINSTGTNKNLLPYIKDYKPSLDIMQKYKEQRHISRIVKVATFGFWLTSIPMLFSHKDAVVSVGLGNFLAGFVYLPIIELGFKAKNHSRPFQAIQKYIDNVVDLAPIKPKDTSAIVAVQDVHESSDSLTTKVASVAGVNTKRDYIVLMKDNQVIVADSGTKLLTANNKIFTINNKKFTSGIKEFQQRKFVYKLVSNAKEKDDFARRILTGKISIYSYSNVNSNKKNYGGGISSLTSHSVSNNSYKESKNDYFEKNNNGRLVKGNDEIASFLSDNPISVEKYKQFITHQKTFKLAQYGMRILNLVCAGVFIAHVIKHVDGYNPYTDPFLYASWGCGIGAMYHFRVMPGKLSKEFMGIIKDYNRASDPNFPLIEKPVRKNQQKSKR